MAHDFDKHDDKPVAQFSLLLPGLKLECRSVTALIAITFIACLLVGLTIFMVLRNAEKVTRAVSPFIGGVYTAGEAQPKVAFKKTFMFWTPRLGADANESELKRMHELDSRYPLSHAEYQRKAQQLEAWLVHRFGGWSKSEIVGTGRRESVLPGYYYTVALPSERADVSLGELNSQLGMIFPIADGSAGGDYFILTFR